MIKCTTEVKHIIEQTMKKSTLFFVLIAVGVASQSLIAGSGGPPTVPEPSTWVAGAFVLVPSGISTYRKLRQRMINKRNL